MPDPFLDDVNTDGALNRAANPFKPGAGQVPPRFGSRYVPLLTAKTMVDRLADGLDPVDQPILRGVRGVGKTALMAYVRERAAQQGTVPLHVEADADDVDLVATCRSLALDARPLTDGVGAKVGRRLAAIDLKGKLEFHPPSPGGSGRENLEALLHDLVLLASDRGTGLLLTVDEVHEAEDTLLRPLVRAMHRHAQDGSPLGVILSGLPGAAQALMEGGQTYTERLRTFDLGMLDDEGVREALAGPFAELADVGIDGDLVDAVLEHTGGYPYFVQVWGLHLWNTLPEARAVTAADMPRARTLVDDDLDSFYQRRWARVPGDRGRDMVRALAARGGQAAIGELANDLDLRSSSDLSYQRQQLIRLGLLYAPSYGRVTFTVPGFDLWIVGRD